MQKYLISLFLISIIGCSSPKFFLDKADINKKNGLFSAEKLKGSTVILFPPRSTMGAPVKNETLETHLYKALPAKFPQTKFLEIQDVYSLLDKSHIQNAYPRFNKLINDYFAHGVFKKHESSVMGELSADYIVTVSVNSGSQNSGGHDSYAYLISMQIWDVGTEKIVWDTTLEGSVLFDTEEEGTEGKTGLINYLCNEMLAGLPGTQE